MAERELTPRIISVEWDDGYAHDATPYEPDELVLLSLPCPGRHLRRGGVGGQVVTACSFCGEVMASTAGPHSLDGRYYKPVVIESHHADVPVVTWRPFHPELRRLLGGDTDG